MKTIYFLFVFSIFSWASVFAQEQSESSPLQASKIVERNALGIYVALGQNVQTGVSYSASFCPECEFEKGVKFGFSFGAVYEYSLDKPIKIGASLGLDFMNVYSSFKEKEELNYNGKKYDEIQVWFRSESDIKSTYLSTNMFFKYQPLKWFFVKEGFNIALPLSLTMQYDKNLDESKIILPGGEIVTGKTFNDNNNQSYEKDYPEKNSPVLGLSSIIGFNIPVAKTTFFSPYFEYYFPFSKISNYGDNFQIKRWRLGAELKYIL